MHVVCVCWGCPHSLTFAHRTGLFVCFVFFKRCNGPKRSGVNYLEYMSTVKAYDSVVGGREREVEFC